MRPSSRRRWPLLFPALVIAITAPSIWSQVLRRTEISKQREAAIKEVASRKGIDEATRARTVAALREAFRIPDGSDWVKVRAVDVVLAELRKALLPKTPTTGLKRLKGLPGDSDVAGLRRTSEKLVDSVSAVIRRRSILEEIGAGESTTLTPMALSRRLIRMKVRDYRQVASSFDSDLGVETVTLRQDTTLLRLYGGESKAIGRYFFCCLWPSKTSSGRDLWADASGLATPPENLLDHLSVATIPAGTDLIVGTVAPNFADQSGRRLPGGGTQLFTQVKNFPFQEYRLKETNATASDIRLHLGDRTVWFGPVAETQ